MRGICCLFNIILLIFSSKYPFQSPRKHVFLDALPQILFCCQFKKGDIVKSCWRISKLKSVQIPPKNRYFYPTSDHSTHHRDYRLSLPINDNCPFDNETEKKRKVRIIPLSCVLACVYMLRRETVSERVCDARRPQTPNTLAINSPRTQMTIDNTNDNVITNDNEPCVTIQRNRGLWTSPSNYERKSCVETILPDVWLGPKSTWIICGNNHRCWFVFCVHNEHPLWPPGSHNMADFQAFWPIFSLISLLWFQYSPFGTILNLIWGWRLGTIFSPSRYLTMALVGQKMANFMAKITSEMKAVRYSIAH